MSRLLLAKGVLGAALAAGAVSSWLVENSNSRKHNMPTTVAQSSGGMLDSTWKLAAGLRVHFDSWINHCFCTKEDGQLKKNKKVFNDPIHGHIEIPAICVAIIDTRQYQRLRKIRQLGGAYFVFPGAAHNRFEHGIGTSFLAGELTRGLRNNMEDSDKDLIDDKDIVCLQIAGLCHDLGHGPFSHVFETRLVNKVRRDEGNTKEWSHEDASLEMFEHLLKQNKEVREAFELRDLTRKDIEFIKLLIDHEKISNETPEVARKRYERTGRNENKDFLYEIISNHETGIDVDKFDYFARDCYHLGFKTSFDHRRIMKFAKVLLTSDGKRHICYPMKEVDNIYDMFYSRAILHHRMCQHKTIKSVEIMHMEALELANKCTSFSIPGAASKRVRISDSVKDMDAYSNLTDGIFDHILLTTDANLLKDLNFQRARELLSMIQKRQIYKCLGEAMRNEPNYLKFPSRKILSSEVEIAVEIARINKKHTIKTDDIIVNIVKFDYGMGPENPVESVFFYFKDEPFDGKKNPRKMPRQKVSHMLPSVFFEQHIRVYSKSFDPVTMEKIKANFHTWCSQRGYTILRNGQNEMPPSA